MSTRIRGSLLVGMVIGGLSVSALALLVHAGLSASDARDRLAETRGLVEALKLTDIALFPEARYTRHLSLADQHSPFQDAPMSLEHFPAGSLTLPRIPPAGRLSAEIEEK